MGLSPQYWLPGAEHRRRPATGPSASGTGFALTSWKLNFWVQVSDTLWMLCGAAELVGRERLSTTRS